MNIDNLKILAAETALKKMLCGRHFSICEIDQVISLLKTIRGEDEYRILSALHCVNFSEIPKELYREFPNLIKKAIGIEAIKIDLMDIKLGEPGRFFGLLERKN